MPSLRLAKLPDRRPVKLTLSVSPDLHNALRDYGEVYAAEYGVREKIEDLAAVMLDTFLANDRGFAKVRKELTSRQAASTTPRRNGTPS